jgi:hypothetical protein
VELAMIADMASEVVPGPVVSHRPFDGEETAVIVGDDEEERLGWRGVVVVGHGRDSTASAMVAASVRMPAEQVGAASLDIRSPPEMLLATPGCLPTEG